MKKTITSLLFTLSLFGPVVAGELVTVKGKIQGRENHGFLYEEGCNGCHQGSGKKNATDQACVNCHGKIGEITLSQSQLPIAEANPHQSIHFADGASCLACHAEHKKKAPLCTDCHRSWFNEM
ncbi:cytochrome c3 family protein [Shewanella algae]|uniref:cytochrome c3 family protein n=1 Tax=Shewanella algae TaxID=38313 RepID=UPI000BB618A8|nr:cytochrome c3 family protein [Shewanella algae]MBO2567729.1 cytochrome c3 family protein [Shewanella algae]MBO2601849.1 cytochrome c3 family protein [Shewanella algae]MBO2673381.1 cytochrome c3 family protein [Shewanella algae]MCE9784872.1 cytochrome c3 family protein [Shewanella algae]PBQ25600.1 cytochrome C [Shewanella algae]